MSTTEVTTKDELTDQLTHEQTWGARFADTVNAYYQIVRELKLPPGSKVLDLKAGTGNFMHQVERLGDLQMYGMDLDIGKIKSGREVYGQSNMVVADPEIPPFARGSFDAIVSRGLLEHIDPKKLPAFFRKLIWAGNGGVMIHEIKVQEDDADPGIDASIDELKPAQWWVNFFGRNRLRVTSDPNRYYLDSSVGIPRIRQMHGFFVVELA